MGSAYISRSPRVGPQMSVFIATPTFIQPMTAYTFSLANTTAELVKANINYQLGIPDDVKNVDDGRNLLVEKAREGNCTHIFFIDSDQFWSSRDVMRILEWGSKGHPIVAGIYPFKSPAEGYPAGRILEASDDGLLSVSFAPTGFMLIDLTVFDALDAAAGKGKIVIPKTGGRPHYFMRTWNENTYDGGDVTFCRRAIKAGYKVRLDPDINVGHVGFHRFQGNFAEFLNASDENLNTHIGDSKDKNRTVADEEKPEARTFFNDRDALRSLLMAPPIDGPHGKWVDDVLGAYGNRPWASTSNLINAIWTHADATQVVEAGCGVTTLIMAAIGIKVTCFEEHKEWAEAVHEMAVEAGLEDNIDLMVAPLDEETGWYKAPLDEHLKTADLLLIDGPQRREGANRSYPVDRVKRLKLSMPFIYDDIDSISGVTHFSVSPADGPQHPFCYGRI